MNGIITLENPVKPSPSKGLKKELTRDKEKENFYEWLANRVGRCLAGRTTLKECYDSYTSFLIRDLKKISVTKRGFSTLLRAHLAASVEAEQVRILPRSGVTIYGIYLKDPVNCD